MDWIVGISRAIEYVEEHLLEEIDIEKVASESFSSSFHFQRIFTILCGFTLGDYIRMRRLSLAGQELIETDNRIIDIALKYGYESQESFSRAFLKFHGKTPNESRKTKSIKSFSRLILSLELIGGNTMEYRIEKKEALKLVCKRQKVRKPESETAVNDISNFWAECGKNGTTKELCSIIPKDTPFNGLLGICFSRELEANCFPYGIGFALGKEKVDTKNFDVIEIPSYTYAVFPVIGKMPDAFQKTYKRICSEFFTTSDYEYKGGIELEVYPSDKVQNEDFYCEIWIAVDKKTK